MENADLENIVKEEISYLQDSLNDFRVVGSYCYVLWPIRVTHVSFIDMASASKKVKTFTYLPAAS